MTVNKNLVGAGSLTADQKKKLLWGNKKNTQAEEVSLTFQHVLGFFGGGGGDCVKKLCSHFI